MQRRNIFELLEEIRAIAQLGLNYNKDVYDRERYERLLAIACSEYASLGDLPSDKILDRFRAELGYITPKVGVSAAIFNSDGEILLVRRTDDQCWCLPCGWAEVRETPQQSVAREVLEETGLVVEVLDLVRLGTRMPGDFGLPHTTYHLEFFCKIIGGTIKESHETTDIGFQPINTPREWHLDHQSEALAALKFWRKHSATQE
jgi:ADP-ribose pyrophosphatase YjhB (NUDIX family)